MDEFLDYFMVLQVHPIASDQVIKSAYKALCHLYHPDNGGDVDSLLKVQEAYETLSSPGKRNQYMALWTNQFKEHNDQGIKRYYGQIFQPVAVVVHRYMKSILNQDYHRAYALLSKESKEMVPIKQFVAWQEMVGQVHELLAFEAEFDELIDSDRQRMVRYEVKVRELNLLLHRLEEDNFKRTLVEEGGKWRVLLPDLDIRQITKKYKRAVTTTKKREKRLAKGKLQIEGAFGTRFVTMGTFEANLEYEFLRTQRYDTPCTLIGIALPVRINEGLMEHKIAAVFEHSLRKMDTFTMDANKHFYLLLPHTNFQQADRVCVKLLELLKELGIERENIHCMKVEVDPTRHKKSHQILQEIRALEKS